MKKVMLGLVMVMMLMSLVGCGTVSNDKGYTPEKIVEEENFIEEDTEIKFSENMTIEEMKQYYDTTKFIGTPRLVILEAELVSNSKDVVTLAPLSSNHDGICVHIPNDNTLKSWTRYYCIITDNNTSDDKMDDELAYIFTTPIE